HGFNDVNTKPTNLLDVWSRLRGPKRAWFGQWDHVRGNEVGVVGRDGFMDEAMAWFDHWLKGMPLVREPAVRLQDADGRWRTEAAWPPADARYHRMPVLPGQYVDVAGNDATQPTEGSWTASQPAPYSVRLSGRVRLTVKASTALPRSPNLVALL